MTHTQVIGCQLYVYMNGKLLYKRWIDKSYGMIFCPTFNNFTAKDTESFNQSIT